MSDDRAARGDVLLAAFHAHLRRRQLSEATCERYRTFLVRYVVWLGGRHPTEVSAQEIEADYFGCWYSAFEARYGRPPSANTARNHHCALSAFYAYLERFDHVAANPMRKLDAPKGERKVNDYLARDEDERLLAAAKTPQERIIVYLLRFTGMRAEVEATQLLQRDVDLSATQAYPYGAIRVRHSKTPRGRRTVPILPELRLELEGWFSYLAKLGLRDPDLPVLVTRVKTPMTHDFIWRVTKRVAYRGGVRVNPCRCPGNAREHDAGCARSKNGKNLSAVTPHTLRRTFGSALREDGISIDAISKALGHADSRTTEESYVDLADATLAREILAASA